MPDPATIRFPSARRRVGQPDAARAWAPALAALAAGCAVLLAAHRAEASAALRVWSTSTAFGHCFLVLPIAVWLAFERRDRLRALSPQPFPAAALLMLPPTMLWLCAERLGVMEGRQLLLLFMLWVLVLACLGPSVFRAMAVPLGYLLFLVPFGAFLVPALQLFTARFIDAGLGALAIPHVVDQTTIEIPEGMFRVAEACAGLRFLIAAIAFGAVYAVTIYRTPGRRLLFLLASVAVPVIANGVRALGIVLLGHLRGSAEAGAVDHVLYGWMFFSIVILLLVLLGLPFRQDTAPRRAAVPARRRFPPPAAFCAGVAVAAVVLALLGPACAWAPDHRARSEQPAQSDAGLLAVLPAPAGCHGDADDPPRQPGVQPGVQPAGQQSYRCGATDVVLRVRRLGSHAGSGLVLDQFRQAEGVIEAAAGEDDVAHGLLAQDGGAWRLFRLPRADMTSIVAVWSDGRPSSGGSRDRLRFGWHSVVGGAGPVTVVCIAATGPDADAEAKAFAQGVGIVMRSGADQVRLPSRL